MYTLSMTFSTADELQEAVNKLNGVEAAATPAKKPTNTTKGQDATKAAFAEKPAAAAPKAKGKKAVPTSEELKAHILEHVGDDADASNNVKAFIKSFGVGKIGDMTDAQRQKAFDATEAHFAKLNAGEDEDDAEEDPMS